MEGINYQDGKSVNFQYNKNGELVYMADWNGATNFTLDILDRIKSVNDHNNKLTSYTYDAVGNQDTIAYPDDTAVANTYDLLGRLKNVKDAENQDTSYDYDAVGQLLSQVYPNGVTETYAYDDAGRLIQQITASLKFGLDGDSQGAGRARLPAGIAMTQTATS